MALYGFHPVGTRDGQPIVLEEFTAGSVALKKYDLVHLESGLLTIVTTTDTDILGVVMEDAAISETGVQVAVACNDLMVFADASAACTKGLSYAITAGTGAQVVDQSTAGDYSMYCVAVSPKGMGRDDDASTGFFVIKNTGTSV